MTAIPYPGPSGVIDAQQVIRIPVIGPGKFNTLAVVRQTFVVGEGTDATLRRQTWSIPTEFALVDFDPRANLFEHSTTGSLRTLQSVDETRDSGDDFTQVIAALDSIETAYFDKLGVWTVDVGIAQMRSDPDTRGNAEIVLSSWVLCYEPPVDPNRPGAHRLSVPGRPAAPVRAPRRSRPAPRPESPGGRSHKR